MVNLLEPLGVRYELSGTTVAGGFLRLHVSGNRADTCFRLMHPPAQESIRAILDCQDRGD
jgi:dihydroflavonol-4-reductase